MSSLFSEQFSRYLRSQLDAAKWEDIDLSADFDDSWVVTPDDIKGYEAWLPADFAAGNFANIDRLTDDDVTGESNEERVKRLVARLREPSAEAYYIPYQLVAPGYCGRIVLEDDDLKTYPIVPTPTVAAQGATCTRCNLHNEYAPPSASYICYECR